MHYVDEYTSDSLNRDMIYGIRVQAVSIPYLCIRLSDIRHKRIHGTVIMYRWKILSAAHECVVLDSLLLLNLTVVPMPVIWLETRTGR